ncbi:MAG: hypothetical protein AAF597_21435 [Bacteroidota bacterium]
MFLRAGDVQIDGRGLQAGVNKPFLNLSERNFTHGMNGKTVA